MDGPPDSEATPDPPDDEVVLDRIRSGDTHAFELLYALHVASARRLAVLLAGPEAADDLVAESVARVLDQLRAGRGPTTNFRAYLHATIRNRHRDNVRSARERPSSDLPWLLDGEEPRAEDLVEGIDSNGAVAALQSLPASWQQILWYLEVEGRRPAEIAELLGLTPVAVSSLAYRARDGLRRAYLDRATFGEEPRSECRWTRARLSQHVRGDLSARASRKVLDHVATCTACAGVLAEMDALNKRLGALVLPVVLVGGMAALDAATVPGAGGSLGAQLHDRAEAGGASAGSAGATSGFGGLLASANLPVLMAAAVTGLVVVGGAVWAVTTRDDHPRQAIAPQTSTNAPATPGETAPTPAPTPAATPTVTPAPTSSPAGTAVAPPGAAATPVRSPVAGPISVVAQAPTAVKIVACETFGSLTMPSTTGVRYTRTSGDGRQGAWAVIATAEPGYVLADGSPTRFSGNLGSWFGCPPSLGPVSMVSQGDPASDPWDITVTPVVTDPAASTLEVVYVFDTGVLITSRSGAGWTCREPGGVEVGAGTEYSFPDPGVAFTCTFAYSGTAPPPVTLSVYGQDANAQIVDPSGTVTLRDDGVTADQQTFG